MDELKPVAEVKVETENVIPPYYMVEINDPKKLGLIGSLLREQFDHEAFFGY